MSEVAEIIASLAEFVRLPVRVSEEDTCSIADAEGRTVCVIDRHDEREAREITGLLILLINTREPQMGRPSVGDEDEARGSEGWPRLRSIDGQLVRQEKPGGAWIVLHDHEANRLLRELDGEPLDDADERRRRFIAEVAAVGRAIVGRTDTT